MISCSIYNCYFDLALYDHGASLSIMPKVIFEQLQYPALSPIELELGAIFGSEVIFRSLGMSSIVSFLSCKSLPI
jgi:hypothetical protein